MGMHGYISKVTGWLALLVGLMGVSAVISLLLFLVGLFQNIESLSFMGRLNDTMNALVSILSAALASVFHPRLHRFLPRLSVLLLIGVWMGAMSVTFGSWLIITDRSDVELSSYYFFFGNSLIGIWLWVLNRTAREQSLWPRSLSQWGLIAGTFMLVGLLGLYGILLGVDGNEYSPLLLITGLSFFGTGIFYPLWSLWLGRWLLSKKDKSISNVQAQRPVP